MLLGGPVGATDGASESSNTSCPGLQFVFVRGSGQELYNSDDWRSFRDSALELVEKRGFSYKILDLPYPAVSVTRPAVAFGAFVSAGQSFRFGKSVKEGVVSLVTYRASVQRSCPDTRWVLVGYSQGAAVLASALSHFEASEVVYVAMMGDPGLYLPEGRGVWPDACKGRRLSRYRVGVPNCHTDNGSLGARNPYELSHLRGKYGLWCNYNDFICGSSKNLMNNGGHMAYVSGDAYGWVLDIVDSKLSINMVSRTRVAGSDIRIHATQTEFWVAPGETVTFDLSPSFSLGYEIGGYLWSFDGGKSWRGGEAMLDCSFDIGDHVVLAKATDGYSESEILELLVHVGNFTFDAQMEAPKNLKLELVESGVKLYWKLEPMAAEYLLVKVNGVEVGFTDVTLREFLLTDIEYDSFSTVEAA